MSIHVPWVFFPTNFSLETKLKKSTPASENLLFTKKVFESYAAVHVQNIWLIFSQGFFLGGCMGHKFQKQNFEKPPSRDL